MQQLQKLGGWAALYEALAYVLGMIFFIGVVDYTGIDDPVQKVALLVENQSAMHLITLIIYVVFGVALVVLAQALSARLKEKAPAIMQVATAFGLIWAGVVIASGMVFNIGMGVVVGLVETDPTQAATVWLAIDAVFNGIGGGVEILGGLWMLLISWAALKTGELAKLLNYIGVLIGLAGILTVVPALGELGGIIFGLGQIVWFTWLGVSLLRSQPSAMSEKTSKFVPGHGTI